MVNVTYLRIYLNHHCKIVALTLTQNPRGIRWKLKHWRNVCEDTELKWAWAVRIVSTKVTIHVHPFTFWWVFLSIVLDLFVWKDNGKNNLLLLQIKKLSTVKVRVRVRVSVSRVSLFPIFSATFHVPGFSVPSPHQHHSAPLRSLHSPSRLPRRK